MLERGVCIKKGVCIRELSVLDVFNVFSLSQRLGVNLHPMGEQVHWYQVNDLHTLIRLIRANDANAFDAVSSLPDTLT